MDPLSASVACGSLLLTITRTTQMLVAVKAKYTEAPITIQLLMSELSTVKAALGQIRDWAEYNSSNTPRQKELTSAFNVSLEGCQLAMEALKEEVSGLVGDKELGQGSNVGMRIKLVWNEESIKDHSTRLRSQTQALQLLLQAVNCHSGSEQSNLLQTPSNRQIIEKVADDTSTLRARSEYSRSIASKTPSIAPSDITDNSSSMNLNEVLLRSEPYRHIQNSNYNPQAGRNRNSLSPLDEYSSIGGQPDPPPQHRTKHKPTKAPAYERSVASEPTIVRPKASFMSLRASSTHGVPSSDGKKSIWNSVTNRSKLLLPNRSPISPTDNTSMISNHSRKYSETNSYTSIYFKTAEHNPPPPIIVASQTGSYTEVEDLLRQDIDGNLERRHEHTGRTPLSVASHCGNESVVALLLERNAKIDARDHLSLTPLHLAASQGHSNVIRKLLHDRAQVDVQGPDARTPLHVACENRQFEIVDLLVKNGARTTARTGTYLTPLHIAAKLGCSDTISALVRNGADIGQKDGDLMTALHYAAEANHVTVVQLLLAKKPKLIEDFGRKSMTTLTLASAAGAIQAVEVLLAKGAKVNAKGEGNMTPLHWASYNNHVEIVELLLKHSARLEVKTVDRRTPLHVAVVANSFSVTDLLLRKGAVVNSQCARNWQPLHYACQHSSADLVPFLLSHGADIEAQTTDEQRPIHIATLEGNESALNYLLERGCRKDERDVKQQRALSIACANGNLKIVRTLLGYGCSVTAKYPDSGSKDSALCVAAKSGSIEIVEELIYHGASIRQKDSSNWQPLRYAAFYGHPEIVAHLLGKGALISEVGSSSLGIGFSADMNIDEGCKSQVLALLLEAEEREVVSAERIRYLEGNSLPVQQQAPAELISTDPRPFPYSQPVSSSTSDNHGPSQHSPHPPQLMTQFQLQEKFNPPEQQLFPAISPSYPLPLPSAPIFGQPQQIYQNPDPPYFHVPPRQQEPLWEQKMAPKFDQLQYPNEKQSPRLKYARSSHPTTPVDPPPFSPFRKPEKPPPAPSTSSNALPPDYSSVTPSSATSPKEEEIDWAAFFANMDSSSQAESPPEKLETPAKSSTRRSPSTSRSNNPFLQALSNQISSPKPPISYNKNTGKSPEAISTIPVEMPDNQVKRAKSRSAALREGHKQKTSKSESSRPRPIPNPSPRSPTTSSWPPAPHVSDGEEDLYSASPPRRAAPAVPPSSRGPSTKKRPPPVPPKSASLVSSLYI